MADEARINIDEDGGNVTITGGGTMTLFNAGEFGEGLRNASKDAESVTVDLRPADFIDTQIVQDLGRAAVAMIARGKRLKVILLGTTYPVKVVRISSYDKIMDVEVE